MLFPKKQPVHATSIDLTAATNVLVGKSEIQMWMTLVQQNVLKCTIMHDNDKYEQK